MGVWASDSFDNIPAGSWGGLYFASRALEDVPPEWRCPDCDGIGAD